MYQYETFILFSFTPPRKNLNITQLLQEAQTIVILSDGGTSRTLEYRLPPGVRLDQRPLTTKLFKLS